jgi:phosphinothricin acetyltransferase
MHTLDEAPKYGITNVVALITEGNDVSIRLHERHAFVPCGRIENVARKLGKVLALILMQKQLE